MKREYKLVSKQEITDLKKEVKDLKRSIRNKTGVKTKTSISDKKLKESMDNLSESISELVNLFTVAKDMREHGAFDESRIQSPELKSLLEQNKAIAKGILAITEILSEHLPKLTNIARKNPKYKLLRVKQNNSMPSRPTIPSEMSIESFAKSELPSMPEADEDFEFSKEQNNNSQQD